MSHWNPEVGIPHIANMFKHKETQQRQVLKTPGEGHTIVLNSKYEINVELLNI